MRLQVESLVGERDALLGLLLRRLTRTRTRLHLRQTLSARLLRGDASAREPLHSSSSSSSRRGPLVRNYKRCRTGTRTPNRCGRWPQEECSAGGESTQRRSQLGRTLVHTCICSWKHLLCSFCFRSWRRWRCVRATREKRRRPRRTRCRRRRGLCTRRIVSSTRGASYASIDSIVLSD